MPKMKENGGDCLSEESYLLGKIWMKPGIYLPKPQIPRCLLEGVVLHNMKSGSKVEHKSHFSNSDLSLRDNGFANMSDPSPPEEWSDGSDPSKVLPSDVKNCIKQLIASYPDGLQLEKLNHTYWQKYGKRLMPLEYGFKDVVDMVHSLAGDVWLEEGAQGQVFLKVNRGEGDAPLQDDTPSRVPMAVRETFKTILKMNHGVCLLDDLLREYEVRTGSRINLIELGFTSVFDLIANLTDIMGMWRLGNGQFILYDLDNPPQSVSNIPECALADSASPKHQRRNLSGETVDRLRRLVEVEYPGGLAIEELVGAYRGLFGATLRDLDHEAYGYLSLEALLRNHPEVVTVQTWGGAIRVMRDQSFVPPEERLQEGDTKEMPASQIPAEAVRPGSLYKCPNVKALMPAGEMVEVVVGEVYSPHRFWMIRRGADTLQALDALMDRMFEFYGSPIGCRYMVPNDFVTIGFPVVALYANDLNFYRAIVTNLEDLTTVRLFFVDYGTICRCDYSSLRLLHRAFLELPAQAIKASLCDVSPPGASRLWPRAASQRFLEMIQNKAFVAQVLVSEKTTSVRLWDTNGEEDVNIGQTLIQEGFAVPQNLNAEEAPGANCFLGNLNTPSSQLHADLGLSVNSGRDGKQSEASRSMSAYEFTSGADDLPRVEKLDSGSSVAGVPVMNSSFAASGKDRNFTEGLSSVSHPSIPDASSAATSGIIVGLLQRMNELQNEVNALKLKSIVDAQMGNHMRPSLVGPILGPLVGRTHTQLGDSARSLSQNIQENPSLGVDVHRFYEAAQGFAFPTVSVPISTLARGPPPGFAPLPFCHSTPRLAVYTEDTEDTAALPLESSKSTEIFYSDEEDGVLESPPAQEEAEGQVFPVCFKGTHTLHLVFAGGEAHLLSGEISRLLWNADILETLLQEKGIVLPSLKMTIASHQDTYLRLVECGTDAVYDDVTGKLQKTLTAFPLHILPWILRYFAHDDQQLLAWAEVLCVRYGKVDREQGEGRELQGQDEQGAGDGPGGEPGGTEAKGSEHRDEGAEEPQAALAIERREPGVGPGELRLEWNEQREELAEPELEFRLQKPTENSLQSNVDVASAKTELEGSPLEFREIPSPVPMGAKACTAGGTVEVLPASDSGTGSEASQAELMEVSFLVAKRAKACTAKGTKKEESLKPDRAVLPASDSETGSETSQSELRGIPSLVPMGAKGCTAEETKSEKSLKPDTDGLLANDAETTSEGTLELREIPSPVGTSPCTTEGTKSEKSLNPSTDVLSANNSKTRSEGTLELREIPSPAPVGTSACTSEGTKRETSPELNACIPQASESEAGSEERLLNFRAILSPVLREAKLQTTNVFAEWQGGNSRPRLEVVPNTELQDTKQDPEPKIQDKQDRTSEKKIWDNTPKQKIQDKTEETIIRNTEIEQTVHMVTKTDLIREGVLKESELQDIKEKLQEMVKYDTQYQKFIGIVEQLQLDIPFQSKSKGIIQRLIKLVNTTWEQTHPQGKGKDSDDRDDEEKEMSLGFVLQSLRNKSRNSSLDSCKSTEAYQEVQLQEERPHDRESESLPTLGACASELAEAEHTNSEMQEEFSNQLKFTMDLPSNQCPKLSLESYPSQKFPGHCNGTVHVSTVASKITLDVREKKHENITALAAPQETAQENRTHKRAPSRGRGKFNLCSVRRPGFDYREDATGARLKNVFFRGRPSQEDLSIFEERDASSSTLSKVNSSRIVSEGIYYNFNAAATSLVQYHAEFMSFSPLQSYNLSHFQGANTYYLHQTYQHGPKVPVLPVWVVPLPSHA